MKSQRYRHFGWAWLAASATACAGALPVPGDIPLTQVVATGLSGPVGIFNAGDGSERLFVIQQGGAVRVVRNGNLINTPFLTLSNASTQCAETVGGALANTGLSVGSETGLLGLAFHPQFESNGQFYLSFSGNTPSAGADGDSIVARFTMSNPAADVVTASDLLSCVIVLRVDQDFSNHNDGNIVFGPDGFLYFGLGDGGNGNDGCNRAQTLNPADLVDVGTGCASDPSFTDPDGNTIPDRSTITRALLGKLLRLDIDGSTPAGANGLCGARLDGAANYAIPPSNPFAGADAQLACDEVWHYGLRNPWRWSFDRQTNDLIIGDVGQDQWEEVDFLPASNTGGNNLGWRLCEGTHVRNSCTVSCALASSILPIIEYNNTNNFCTSSTTTPGASVTGGYRYRGPDAALQGVYFYGDAGAIGLRYAIDNGGGNWTPPQTGTSIVTAGLPGITVAFGEDEGGAVYFLSGNTLWRIGGAPISGLVFANGFE